MLDWCISKDWTQLQSLDLAEYQGDRRRAGASQRVELNSKSLDLAWTKVTDAGLVHLKGLTQLQSLDLS